MKITFKNIGQRLLTAGLMIAFLAGSAGLKAQEAPEPEKKAPKPVKNTFEGNMIIDNQTAMVPIKNTFEFTINHRFGVWKNGYDDLFGIFAPANISLGVNFAPINNLQLGVNLIKQNMVWEGTAKYSLVKQTPGTWKQVSITYFGVIDYDSRKEGDVKLFKYKAHRLMYFNQLLIARKITDNLSIQVAPSYTYNNFVESYFEGSDTTVSYEAMKHGHISISTLARYKITDGISVIANYDHPITKHNRDNPYPNIAAGLEFNTSGHSFQIFFGNYGSISPARNNYLNRNNHKAGDFMIGFNINRIWNF